MRRVSRWLPGALAAASLAACSGVQSALDPAGRGAERLANLFWVMAAGAAIIWLIVIGLAVYALRNPENRDPRKMALYVIGGGAAFPVVVLTILLLYGLTLMPELLEPAPAGSLRITVVGEQWWWRVRYERPGGEPVDVANEIHLPVNEPVEFLLGSADVIHSFWIPSLGGKLDMIPGRSTRLTLHPTETGVFRGACAEYCGSSHALMSLDVVVHERPEFDRWLDQQAQPSASSEPRGENLFLMHGCGACHTIRGTAAGGTVGPDLTHVGSRLKLAASALPNDPAEFNRWIAGADTIKPGAHMPAFGMLPAADLVLLAAYLEGLQ